MMPAAIGLARPADAEDVLRLVATHCLPLDGLREHLATAIVARDDGNEIVGTAALEMYQDGALLRSVAVASPRQGRGVGRALTDAAIQLAVERGARAIFLLTTTAERYFSQFGFERITRNEVPQSVQVSIEFVSACPASAVVMRRLL
ncbi:MAG TPA: arsenic resistance N-acetyltransferase ArsN2 [Vicinamibacterales bacterium]|nr:arsenic resistance N-acetyltransferase ArsN2 [Vicinamibacterales bacterium]